MLFEFLCLSSTNISEVFKLQALWKIFSNLVPYEYFFLQNRVQSLPILQMYCKSTFEYAYPGAYMQFYKDKIRNMFRMFFSKIIFLIQLYRGIM